MQTTNISYAEALQAELEPHLPRGYPTAQLAASLMNVSVRTLARRLSELGITYRDLIDQARFRVARHLLRDTKIPVGDIAARVGFADASNFARMFRRASGGLSPCEYRRRALDPDRAAEILPIGRA